MHIIETKSEFTSFLEKSKNYDWIVVPTYCNGDRAVHIDSISVIFIYVINLDLEALLVFNHTEGLTLSETLLQSFPIDNKLFVELIRYHEIGHVKACTLHVIYKQSLGTIMGYFISNVTSELYVEL